MAGPIDLASPEFFASEICPKNGIGNKNRFMYPYQRSSPDTSI
jgi:hypothetical protein